MHLKKQSLAVLVVAGVAMVSHKAQAKALGTELQAPEEGDIDMIVSTADLQNFAEEVPRRSGGHEAG